MARLARIVVPGMPHHIIQRGNRRQKVFLREEDKAEYLQILRKQGQRYGVHFWAYCLMDNHVHLISVPEDEDSLAQGIGTVHKEYTRMINFREGWRGYLWQGRFLSYVLDERYLYSAVRYVERNPVRAGMVEKAWDYKWSSASCHADRRSDRIVEDFYLTDEITDWKVYLEEDDGEADLKRLRSHIHTGRPLGSDEFLSMLEKRFGIEVRKRKPGPKVGN
jgi:putative transposase